MYHVHMGYIYHEKQFTHVMDLVAVSHVVNILKLQTRVHGVKTTLIMYIITTTCPFNESIS